MTQSRHEAVVERQFGAQANAYLTSAVHASGRDLQRLAERLARHARAQGWQDVATFHREQE